jgi:fructose-1,6-bisphosphatase/inositol monophosphatase family enzyme
VILDQRDIAAVVALLREVAATEIMPRFGKLTAADIRTKSGPLDPVTIADEAAERALDEGLRRLFPGTDVIGEEGCAGDPALLDRLTLPGPVWVIDPIDGTANYAAELPLFGSMIALIDAGRVLAGFIHDPLGGDTAIAMAGGGAWLIAADDTRRQLRVAAPVPVARMTGAISWRYLREPLRSRILHRLDRIAATPDFRCAAHQYRMLAAGHCHVQLFGRLLPWDHAAGVLLHREAGGYGAHFDGTAYHPAAGKAGLLMAPDEASWRAFAEVFLAP